MSKIEERKSVAATLVELYKGLIEALPENGDITAKSVIALAADVMNVADRRLFTQEDMGMAIAGVVMREFELVDEKSFLACKAFGEFFCTIFDARPEYFAPGSKQLELLEGAFLVLANNEILTVSDLARKLDGALETNRALIKRDIRDGRLKAKKIGKQYQIDAADAAEWLANPARGSRVE